MSKTWAYLFLCPVMKSRRPHRSTMPSKREKSVPLSLNSALFRWRHATDYLFKEHGFLRKRRQTKGATIRGWDSREKKFSLLGWINLLVAKKGLISSTPLAREQIRWAKNDVSKSERMGEGASPSIVINEYGWDEKRKKQFSQGTRFLLSPPPQKKVER